MPITAPLVVAALQVRAKGSKHPIVLTYYDLDGLQEQKLDKGWKGYRGTLVTKSTEILDDDDDRHGFPESEEETTEVSSLSIEGVLFDAEGGPWVENWGPWNKPKIGKEIVAESKPWDNPYTGNRDMHTLRISRVDRKRIDPRELRYVADELR